MDNHQRCPIINELLVQIEQYSLGENAFQNQLLK